MGFKLTELYAELTAKDSGFKSAMTGAKKLTDSAGSSLSNIAHSAKEAAFELGVTLTATAAVFKSIESFAEKETAANNLSAAIRLTGDTSKFSANQAREFAESIESVTTVSAEAVMNAMRFGAAVGRLRGEGLEKATIAAVGLSAALGVDLERAMTLIVKAKEGNTAALKRLGIQIDENLSKQQKYAEVLRIGAEAMSLATAQTETLAGSWAQAKNQASDLAAQMVDVMSPALKESLKWLKLSIEGWREFFLVRSGKPNIQNIEPLKAFSALPIERMREEHQKTEDALREARLRTQEPEYWFRREPGESDAEFKRRRWEAREMHKGESGSLTIEREKQAFAAADSLNDLYMEQARLIRAKEIAESESAKETAKDSAAAAETAKKNARDVADFEHQILEGTLSDEERKVDAVNQSAQRQIEIAKELHDAGKTSNKQYADELIAIEAAKEAQLDRMAKERAAKQGKELADRLAGEREYKEKSLNELAKAHGGVAAARERLQQLRDESARPQTFGGADLINRIQEGMNGERIQQIEIAKEQLETAKRQENLLQAQNDLLKALDKLPGGLLIV